MGKIELLVKVENSQPTVSATHTNSASVKIPVKAEDTNEPENFKFSIELPEKNKNIAKEFLVALTYPAILGVFIFEIFNSIANPGLPSKTTSDFHHAPAFYYCLQGLPYSLHNGVLLLRFFKLFAGKAIRCTQPVNGSCRYDPRCFHFQSLKAFNA